MLKVILFYKYVPIIYPKRIMKWQKKICSELHLKGRVLIAHEGVNGTLSGSIQEIDRYVSIMRAHPEFSDVDFKTSTSEHECFPRMQVTTKAEIVCLKEGDSSAPLSHSGIHLKPEQAHALIKEKPQDLVILDTRNRYESAIGTFTDAVKAPIDNFRELPDYLDNNLEMFKDKKVLMFCTGGVRCERATAYLKKKNVAQEVYQMDGGIHRYAEQYPDGFFRGKNYVFDGRIAVKVTDDVLGACFLCNKSCDSYTNCLNATCNKHFISCTSCTQKYQNSCSNACQKLIAEKKVSCRSALGTTNKQQY